MAKANTLFLKPAEGLIVRDPVTHLPLAQEGEDKPDNIFWNRRLRFGDAFKAPRPRASKPAKTGASKTEKDS